MAKAHQPVATSPMPDNRLQQLTADQATDAIVSLINSRPHSPCRCEIADIVARVVSASFATDEVSDGGSEIHGVAKEIQAAVAEFEKIRNNDPVRDALESRLHALWAQLERLAARLPMVPSTWADLLTIGEVAYCWVDKKADGRLYHLADDDPSPDDYWAHRLIFAVAAMGGRLHV